MKPEVPVLDISTASCPDLRRNLVGLRGGVLLLVVCFPSKSLRTFVLQPDPNQEEHGKNNLKSVKKHL